MYLEQPLIKIRDRADWRKIKGLLSFIWGPDEGGDHKFGVVPICIVVCFSLA